MSFQKVYVDLRSQRMGFSVTLHNVGLFREAHKETEAGAVHLHDHAAVRGNRFSYLPVKKALLNRHGLATHWSCRHSGYWSALRYGAWPSPPEKPNAVLDKNPLLWARIGVHRPIRECINEPLTAQATAARRAAKEVMAADQGVQAPKVTELDLYAIIVQKGFRNTDDYPHAHQDLISYVKQHCSTAVQASDGINFGIYLTSNAPPPTGESFGGPNVIQLSGEFLVRPMPSSIATGSLP